MVVSLQFPGSRCDACTDQMFAMADLAQGEAASDQTLSPWSFQDPNLRYAGRHQSDQVLSGS